MRKYLILTCVCLLFVFDSKAQVEITSAGTSSAYTLNVPGVFPLRNGIQVTFKAHTTCSASATMNVSGTGALAIMKEGNTVPLAGGDIKSGQIVVLAYDGTNWQMLSNIGNSVSVPATYWNLNGSDIYNSNGGNVGVGTPTPTSKLEVQSNANGISDALFLSNTTNADNYGARLAFRSQFIATPWSTAEISGIVSNGITQGSLIFSVMNNRATSSMIEAMRITGNGRVGIGTTNPAENLQISNANNANISLIGSASLSNKLYFGSTAFAYLGAVEYNNNDNSMNFWTNNTPNRIYIDNAGKVGIGNNAPSSALHVTGNARVTGLVGPGTVIADASGNLSVAAGTTITGSGTNNYLARWTPSGSQLGIGATYDDGTNVGVGTPVPAKASGANKYLTVSATDIGTTNASASLEMVGNAAALNTMASRVDFLGVTPVTNVIYTRARVEARTGNGATGHGQLVFYTFNGTLNEAMRIRESGHIGIGGSPGVVGSPLSVGATSQFQINSTGNLTRINDVPYSWPASNTSGFLSNDGSGNLSWSTAGVLAGGIANKVTYWTSSNSVSASNLFHWDNTNTRLGIGTAAPDATLNIEGSWDLGTGNLVTGVNSGAIGSTNSVAGNRALSLGNFTSAASLGAMVLGDWSGGAPTTLTSSASDQFSARFAGGYRFFTNATLTATQAIYFSNAGKVGLGVASPLEAIHAASTDTDVDLETYSTTESSSLHIKRGRGTYAAPTIPSSGDYYGGVGFQAWDGTAFQEGARIQGVVDGTVAATDMPGRLEFWTSPDGSATAVERMRITNSGNVGIGTAAPGTSRLNVVIPSTDAINPIGLTVTNNYTGASSKFGIDVNVDGAGTGTKYGISSSVIGLAGDASAIYGYQVAMTPNGSGSSFGIYSSQSAVGTGFRYGIYNNVSNSTTNTSTSYGLYNSVSKPAGSSGNIYNGYFSTSNSGAGTSYGIYATGEQYNYFSGTVGIGVTLPSTSLGLEVQKSSGGYVANFENLAGTVGDDGIQISLGNTLPNTTAFYLGCYAGGGLDGGLRGDGAGGVALYTASDRNLKQNIVEIPSALNTLSKISAKQYEFKAAPGKKMHGFIAQELFEVYPEAVAVPENENDIYMVNYSALTPLLTGGVNELYKLVKDQQAELELLKKQLEEQKKQIEKLEKK